MGAGGPGGGGHPGGGGTYAGGYPERGLAAAITHNRLGPAHAGAPGAPAWDFSALADAVRAVAANR